ncbi:Cameo2 [Operophtera brumata]|uniref:Cameo2 n=1 Tax=Operophtera brumata TaxID=104452 RepID=A0A0L7LMD4_OPEBR|nr:Cameo2 [Operophtera brumata]
MNHIGPYRFREVRKHVNVTVHAHNSSVAYRTQRSWFFDSASSNGSLQDTVTSINMIAASAMFQNRHSGTFRQIGLSTTFTLLSTSLFVTKTMGEMLFDGYEDAMLLMSKDLSENSTLTMFVPDLCRTVHLEHVDSGVMDGLDYHKFEMKERCFDKSSVSDENNCFCNGECKWSGVMNVSACRFDAPAFLSLPHFLYADPALREGVSTINI